MNNKNKNDYLIDVPVALFFFARPQQTAQVFEQIKRARPSKLFLIQDGARNGRQDDVDNILACRAIVDDIDWECEVYKRYSDINLGCGANIATGMSWVFGYVDRVIKLEDDTVPSISFFRFCAELLERYKDDTRIANISGVNVLEQYEGCGDDYIFSHAGSIWAFATWKRVWDNYDYDCQFADNKYYREVLKRNIYPDYLVKRNMKYLQTIVLWREKGLKRTSWSGPFGFMVYLQSQMFVIPKINMIKNVGIGNGATNGGTSMKLVAGTHKHLFGMDKHEIEFPLKHPRYIIKDKVFMYKANAVKYGGNNALGRFVYKIEKCVRIILFRYLKF
jgi:hypothetical protein